VEEITLLYASVDDPRLDRLHLPSLLSPSERTRIARLVQNEDKSRSLVAWGLTRILIGERIETDPEAIRIRRTPHGKPFVPGGPSFNMAHSGTSVLIGVTESGRLGVDVEARRRIPRLERLAEDVFAGEELSEFRALSPADREAAFFRGWVRKEAFLKAVGQGLSMPLHSIAISLAPGWHDCLRSVDGAAAEADNWLVRSIPVPADAEAAIACDLARVRLAWMELGDLSSRS